MTLGGDDVDVFHADAAQVVGHEMGGLLNVWFVLVERADAGDAKKIFELIEETLLMIAGKIDCRRSHGYILSGTSRIARTDAVAETLQYTRRNQGRADGRFASLDWAAESLSLIHI